MKGHRSAINRRQVMRWIGGAAAASAISPCILGGADHIVSGSVLTEGPPGDVGMSADRVEDVFARVEQRVKEGLFPGAVALIARDGVIVGQRAFGSKVPDAKEPVSLDTLFDLESITKVVATAPAVLVLAQRGQLKLDDKVAKYLPAFAANGKSDIDIRDMLRYSAGLPIDNQFLGNPNRSAVWQLMAETHLEYEPGTTVQYSDLTYRLLGKLIEVAAGVNLATFARDNLWAPLGMNDTMYTPSPALLPRIAATGRSANRGHVIRGQVQDDQDFALGGITGCDGVFSTAKDLAIFCHMVLSGGSYDGVRILNPSSVSKMISNQTPQVTAAATDTAPLANLVYTPKGYGWELVTPRFSAGGTRLSPGSYGKTGGAGTYMWIDPVRRLFGVLLTNRGLPIPFDEPGWNRLIRDTGPGEFYDGIINAVIDH